MPAVVPGDGHRRSVGRIEQRGEDAKGYDISHGPIIGPAG